MALCFLYVPPQCQISLPCSKQSSKRRFVPKISKWDKQHFDTKWKPCEIWTQETRTLKKHLFSGRSLVRRHSTNSLVICSYCGFKTDRLRSPVERFMTLLPENSSSSLILLSLYLTLFFLFQLSLWQKKIGYVFQNILPTFAVYCPRLYSAICVDILLVEAMFSCKM